MGLETRTTTPQIKNYQTFSSPAPHHLFDSNARGRESEQHVAAVLRTLPEVKKVIITDPNSKAEKQMADLLVFLAEKNGIHEKPWKVQVKSSDRGWSHFTKTVGHRLRSQGKGLDTPENRQDYMNRNRLLCINGGEVTIGKVQTESGETRKIKRPVTDDEIKANFNKQMRNIRDYAATSSTHS